MAQHHARAMLRCAYPAVVVAVADPSESARAGMLAITPDAREYESLDRLLGEERVDVVDVCTPPATHEGLAERALRAGCHVYVEKPFVESAAAASRLLELASSRGLTICPGHQLLYEPPARKVVELLPAIGRLAHVESYFSFRTVRRSPDGRAPLRADLQLLDILPHPVYLLLDILERSGPGRTELTALEVGAAGTVHAVVRRGKLSGTLVVTLEGRPVESYLRLSGSNGSLFADFVRGTVQQLVGPGTSGIDKLFAPYQVAWQTFSRSTAAFARRILKRQRSYPGLAELFEAFFRSILQGTPAPVSPESLIETVRIWEQIARALEAPPQRAAVAPASSAGRW
jgi:predicted dehydrogenase